LNNSTVAALGIPVAVTAHNTGLPHSDWLEDMVPKAPTEVPADAGMPQSATAVDRAAWHTHGKLNGASWTPRAMAAISLSDAVDINEADYSLYL
jgi:hypothetical protein